MFGNAGNGIVPRAQYNINFYGFSLIQLAAEQKKVFEVTESSSKIAHKLVHN